MSAIILDRNYYDYLTAHFDVIDGIRYASADALVCLKALAYLNLLSDKKAGKRVNEDDIKKHRRDVIMAAAYLPAGEQYKVGENIRKMLDEFLLAMDDASVIMSHHLCFPLPISRGAASTEHLFRRCTISLRTAAQNTGYMAIPIGILMALLARRSVYPISLGMFSQENIRPLTLDVLLS